MDEIMSLEELCVYLKLPKSTLYKLSQRGQLPSSKIGRQLRFRKSEINRWMEEQERSYKDRGKSLRVGKFIQRKNFAEIV